MVGYIRVSTGKQADSGLSLEAQETKVRAMATLKDCKLSEVIVDAAESAKDLDRPGAQKVLKMVRGREVSGVVITKLDRLTRSVRDLADLLDLFRRKNVALISVAETLDTSTASGRLVINVMGSVGQWEREIIGERTADALQAKLARGERAGNVAYGWRADATGALHADPSEQAAISKIQKLRSAGTSLREIADSLNAEGLRTRRGTEWRFQYVSNALKGPK